MPNVRRWGAALAGAAVCLAAALPALAHTELIGSSPADGATLTTPPAEVLLEFSEPVQAEFGQVAVLDDAEQGNPKIVGAKVTQGVDELSAGTYRISYRVGSADGHPITGTLAFTVTAETTPPDAAPTTPTPVATSVDPHEGINHADHPNETATPVAESAAGSGDALLYAGGGVAVAAVLGAVLYVALDRRRPRDEPNAEEAGPGQ
jgi:copper resistance protein C